MSNRSERIKKQLGMSQGTANNRLKKKIMFKFAQELGYDSCYACGEKIETPDDLSIEHKEPWEGRDHGEEKYWDLDNIAFSHLDCNIPHYQGAVKLRKVGPEGTAWCSKHQDFLPVEKFGPRQRTYNGLNENCRECEAKRQKALRQGTVM